MPLLANYSFSKTVDSILATVNEEIITLSDYKDYVSRRDPGRSLEEVDETFLKALIEEKIILQEALGKNIDVAEAEVDDSIENIQKENNLNSEEFKKLLDDEGVSLSEYRQRLRENIVTLKIVDQEVNAKVIIPDQVIADYYQRNLKLFIENPEKKRVKAIFLSVDDSPSVTEVTDLKIKSLKIYEQIKGGEPFDKMVGIYSDEPLKSRNGLLGEFERGGLISSLEQRIEALDEGRISEPVWTMEGVYILKVDKIFQGEHVSFEEVKDSIYNKLLNEKREEKFNDWMKSLWEKSSIDIKKR
jgi:peptidyl-prolyl cis-trans isomerase SurA